MHKKKKKILLLSDDMRSHSGVATQSKQLVLSTAHHYDWVQLGANPINPDDGKIVDVSQPVNEICNIQDAYVRIYGSKIYGSPDILRNVIQRENPDAILHFTDPRQWEWLYNMDNEIRESIPLVYWTIWDDTPDPLYNRPWYLSCDLLMCISRQTYGIVKRVLSKDNYEDWQIKYVPHGISSKEFFPIHPEHEQYTKFLEFKSKVIKPDEKFIVLLNSRNQWRKQIPDLIVAFREFCKMSVDPEDGISFEDIVKSCVLLLHTEPVSNEGTDLIALVRDLAPDVNIRFTPQGISTEEMNFLYNAASVTVSVSSNEGFGLSTAESVMSGTPIIATVTGGLQDQLGMKILETKDIELIPRYVTADDYIKIGTLADLNRPFLEKEHFHKTAKSGDWAYEIFPSVRTLQGSPATPYLYRDHVSIKDISYALRFVYAEQSKPDSELYNKKASLKGIEYFKNEGQLTSEHLGKNVIEALDTMFENFKPKKRAVIQKVV